MKRTRTHPSQWGPAFWAVLHTAAYAYVHHPTETAKQGMQKFVRGFEHAIPCHSCASHYKDFLDTWLTARDKKAPWEGRKSMVEFVRQLHIAVNRRINSSATPKQRAQRKLFEGESGCRFSEEYWTTRDVVTDEKVGDTAVCPARLGASADTTQVVWKTLVVLLAVAVIILLYRLRHCHGRLQARNRARRITVAGKA